MHHLIKQLLSLKPFREIYTKQLSKVSAELALKQNEIVELKKLLSTRENSYNQDGLISIHNHDFMDDTEFCAAYERGIKASGADYAWHWRVYIGQWAATVAKKLEGDFVECGVNAGFMSSSIMHLLDWDTCDKTFYLLDTFNGIDSRYVTDDELEEEILEKDKALKSNGFYVTDLEAVRENFSEWNNLKIIPGSVPETLTEVTSEKIAFLHLDMNCAPPEYAALDYFWDRLVSGAIVLLDDYAYDGYHHQKTAIDNLAKQLSIKVLSLPTGQGLIIKP